MSEPWKRQRQCVMSGGQWRDGRCVHRDVEGLDEPESADETRTPLLTMEQAAGLVEALNASGVAYLVVVRELDRRGFTDRPEVRSPEEFVRFLLTLDEAL